MSDFIRYSLAVLAAIPSWVVSLHRVYSMFLLVVLVNDVTLK